MVAEVIGGGARNERAVAAVAVRLEVGQANGPRSQAHTVP